MKRAILALSLLPAMAMALPDVQSVDDRVDDATLTLRVLDRLVQGDSRSFCEVRIFDRASDESLTAGDTILIWVYEDDALGDDLLWETEFNVSAQEAQQQRLDRTLDCSSAFGDGDGIGDNLEIYAEARVEKSECGFGCAYDRPETAALDVAFVGDDGAEDDDGQGSAVRIPIGPTGGRVARDADWFEVVLDERAIIDFQAAHRAHVGRLDVAIFAPGGALIANGGDGDDVASLVSQPLLPGTYGLRVTHRDGDDFNFYDVRLRVELRPFTCQPGVVEEAGCGSCGARRRTCGQDGEWAAFGPCGGEGVCAPGAMREDACGLCGQRTDACNGACEWVDGVCQDEGPCNPGSSEQEVCPEGGTRRRECDQACQWGAFAECVECDDGATRACYDGAPGTEGVGACIAGLETCIRGEWSDCDGMIGPASEACGDAADDDCDGLADDEDPDCLADRGGACEADGECLATRCLDGVFPAGYCADEGCGACDDGVCVAPFGADLCLAGCAADLDCRPGYLCLDGACTPPCRDDGDCGGVERPLCGDGRCVPEGGEGEGEGEGEVLDQGVTPPIGQSDAGTAADSGSATAEPVSDCNCRAGESASRPWWMMMVLLVGLRRRGRGGR